MICFDSDLIVGPGDEGTPMGPHTSVEEDGILMYYFGIRILLRYQFPDWGSDVR